MALLLLRPCLDLTVVTFQNPGDLQTGQPLKWEFAIFFVADPEIETAAFRGPLQDGFSGRLPNDQNSDAVGSLFCRLLNVCIRSVVLLSQLLPCELEAGAPEVDVAGGPVIAVGRELSNHDPQAGLAACQRAGDLEPLP